MNWKRQIPNLITGSRILAAPFVVGALLIDQPLGGFIAAGLFILASITDYYDGYFARKLNVESPFGKFLDPVADKVLVTSTLVMLIPSGRLGPIMVIILLCRDVIIGGIRSAAASENLIIGAGNTGKWKTAFQMTAIPAVLIQVPLFGIPIFEIGYWLLWISVGLSVFSGAEYCIRYFRQSRNF
jgi:CDP-diacylglycerol--glycerol-3-phosphate 3-phosphatidyltransferase